MALTFSDANASIFVNEWFKGRVRTASSNWVNYLLNTATNDPEYDAKVSAGQRIATQSEHVVQTLMYTLAGDTEVQAAGPGIPDATLQILVEKTIKLFWPVTPLPQFAMPPMMQPMPVATPPEQTQ